MASGSALSEHFGRNGREVRESLLLKNTRSKALTQATGELMNSGYPREARDFGLHNNQITYKNKPKKTGV